MHSLSSLVSFVSLHLALLICSVVCHSQVGGKAEVVLHLLHHVRSLKPYERTGMSMCWHVRSRYI